MVAKSERLRELEALERTIERIKARERARIGIVSGLVVVHRLEPGAAFTEAERVLAHPRALEADAIDERLDAELERIQEAKAQEHERIGREALETARSTGFWPDGTPFVSWPGMGTPPAPAAPPAAETDPIGPPAAPAGEAGDVTPSP